MVRRVREVSALQVHLEAVMLRVHVDRHLDGVTEGVDARKLTVTIEAPNVINLPELGKGILVIGKGSLLLSLIHYLGETAFVLFGLLALF